MLYLQLLVVVLLGEVLLLSGRITIYLINQKSPNIQFGLFQLLTNFLINTTRQLKLISDI